MTTPPKIEIVLAAQEFLETEFAKPEWQEKLTSCSIRHLRNRDFPPSEKFPAGGTTMHFELVCNDILVALLDKFVPRNSKVPYPPEWRPQALLIGDKWHLL